MSIRYKVGKEFFSAKNIAVYGVLVALVIVLQLFATAIPVGTASLNFSLIPIVLGALLFGMWGGAFLGAVAGFIVFLTACVVPTDGLFVYMFSVNPVMMFLICVLKTTLAGLVSGLLFDVLSDKNKYVAIFVASGIVPIVNTGLYFLGMLMLGNAFIAGIGGEAVLEGAPLALFILAGVGLNFVLELAINVILAPALHTVYKVAEKRFSK